MTRKTLASNVKPTAKEAAEAVTAMSGTDTAQDYTDAAGNPLHETVSYNLPVELIELVRDLAEERVKVERAQKRAIRREIEGARRKGEPLPAKAPTQARKSASAIVREALDAYRPQIEDELRRLTNG